MATPRFAACTANQEAINQVYNIAYGERTTLNELFDLVRGNVADRSPAAAQAKLIYRDFRSGDIRHSLAYIGMAKELLGHEPQYSVKSSLERAGEWYASLVA